MQNYSSKSETAIIVAVYLKHRRLHMFSSFQSSHFGLLIFFTVSSFFSAVSFAFFTVSKLANTCEGRELRHSPANKKMKKMSPAITPDWKMQSVRDRISSCMHVSWPLDFEPPYHCQFGSLPCTVQFGNKISTQILPGPTLA